MEPLQPKGDHRPCVSKPEPWPVNRPGEPDHSRPHRGGEIHRDERRRRGRGGLPKLVQHLDAQAHWLSAKRDAGLNSRAAKANHRPGTFNRNPPARSRPQIRPLEQHGNAVWPL